MQITRRDFLKSGVAATTAATVGLPLTRMGEAAAAALEKDWQWDKSVCRFCGVGCGIMVATKGGRIVATTDISIGQSFKPSIKTIKKPI